MIFRLLALAVLFGLTGCASSGISNWMAAERKATESYGCGSTVGGGYSGLYLFPDGKWSAWSAGCTEARETGQGQCRKTGNQITLLSNSQAIQVYTIHPHKGETYLLSEREVREMKKNPSAFNIWTSYKKRSYPRPE